MSVLVTLTLSSQRVHLQARPELREGRGRPAGLL